MTEEQSKTVKEYYSSYESDDKIRDVNKYLIQKILSYDPVSVFEFGCGTGKILERLKLQKHDIARIGIDISKNNIEIAKKRGRGKFVIYGDETDLEKFVDWTVAYTCSVLDHIPDKKQLRFIINHLKRIAKKAVVICETNDVPGKFYFPHNYEEFGFKKTNISVTTDPVTGDGATYNIWVYEKC